MIYFHMCLVFHLEVFLLVMEFHDHRLLIFILVSFCYLADLRFYWQREKF